VIAAFVPSVINELAGPISMITNRMLDEHLDSLNLAAHLAEPMPIAVLGQLLGVSLSEAEAPSSSDGAMTSCCLSGVISTP
jgi:cytochrome P450